jgi:hypothetical protein
MRVQINKWAGIAVYLASVSGACIACALLSHHVAKQAVALVLPYLPDESPRQLSLVERRQIEAVQATHALPTGAETTEFVLTAPATPPQVMAAQLDLAEKADLSSTQRPPKPIRSTSRRIPRPVLSAADEFGRRFGVLTVASAQSN